MIALDLVHEFHRFDNAEHLARIDHIADLDEHRRAGGGRFIKSPDDGGLDGNQGRVGQIGVLGRGRARAGGGRMDGRRRGIMHRRHDNLLRGRRLAALDPNAVVATLDFELGNACAHNGLDELIDFFNGHA